MTPQAAGSYLEGWGSIEFGGINGVRRHVGYVGDEPFKVVTGLLQVSGVDDDLNQLRESNVIQIKTNPFLADTAQLVTSVKKWRFVCFWTML